MEFKTYRIAIVLVFVITTSFSNTLSAQDFFKDYRQFLLGNSFHKDDNSNKRIDSVIARLAKTIFKFESDYHQSFFNSDSVFLVNFLGAETHFPSTLIWNKNHSCYYAYTFELRNWKIASQTLEIKTDASVIVKELSPHFKALVETGDNAGYYHFAESNKVYDGEYVSPIIAIKTNGRWVFKAFRGDGWAVDVFNSFAKTDKPTDIKAIINDLSIKNFGLNIDSAKAAYAQDTSKLKKSPQFPVILLNGKVINFDDLKKVMPYSIKSISIWSKNTHDPAIPDGISSEFGIISIAANDK